MAWGNWVKGEGGRFAGSTGGGHGGGGGSGHSQKLAALRARVKAAQAALEKTRSAQAGLAGKLGKLQAKRSMFAVKAGQRVHDKIPTRAGTYTVKLAALSGAARPTGLAATNREVGIREALRRGMKFGAISVHATSGGRLEVHDGNNRLAVARERGESVVRVRLTREMAARLRKLRRES